jgi:cold shock CspA family protein/ribosome-associated translation inhibitor RaiA
METPVQFDLQGMKADEWVRSAVATQIAALEERFGRLTGCRVRLKAPSARHRAGGLFEVNIHLALPDGRKVNVGRTPKADERYSDLSFAINDAFHRARRQLRENVRRMQGQTKTHEEAPLGTVSKIEAIDGFGMLTSADGREIYFHRNSVLNGGFSKLKVGTRVMFAEEAGNKGPQASTVKPLGKHGMR